jgi:ferredoxin-type protein NapH
MCIECIHRCPEKNALSLSYAGLKFYKASRKNFIDNQGLKKN